MTKWLWIFQLTKGAIWIIRRQDSDDCLSELAQERSPSGLVKKLDAEGFLQFRNHVVDDKDRDWFTALSFQKDHIGGGHTIIFTYRQNQ